MGEEELAVSEDFESGEASPEEESEETVAAPPSYVTQEYLEDRLQKQQSWAQSILDRNTSRYQSDLDKTKAENQRLQRQLEELREQQELRELTEEERTGYLRAKERFAAGSEREPRQAGPEPGAPDVDTAYYQGLLKRAGERLGRDPLETDFSAEAATNPAVFEREALAIIATGKRAGVAQAEPEPVREAVGGPKLPPANVQAGTRGRGPGGKKYRTRLDWMNALVAGEISADQAAEYERQDLPWS